jgi:hypothetical protein
MPCPWCTLSCGATRIRTADILRATQVLYLLSYNPKFPCSIPDKGMGYAEFPRYRPVRAAPLTE